MLPLSRLVRQWDYVDVLGVRQGRRDAVYPRWGCAI